MKARISTIHLMCDVSLSGLFFRWTDGSQMGFRASELYEKYMGKCFVFVCVWRQSTIPKVLGLLDVSLASWARKPTSLTQREEATKRLSCWHWPYELQSTRGQGPQPHPCEGGGFSSSTGAHRYGGASAPPHRSQGLLLSPDTPWTTGLRILCKHRVRALGWGWDCDL